MPRKPANLIYGLDESPSLHTTVLLGLQHIIALSSAFVYPVILLQETGMLAAQAERMIHASMIVMGVCDDSANAPIWPAEDVALRQRLVRAPKQVLLEKGVPLPADTEIEFLANTSHRLHLILPPLADKAPATEQEKTLVEGAGSVGFAAPCNRKIQGVGARTWQ